MIPCPNQSELLELALGRLPGTRKSVIEAHLERCVVCADELAALTRLRDAARSGTTLPDGLNERAWRALPPQKSRTLWRPLAIGTGVAMAAGIATLALLPGGPLRPTISFAQVEKAMEQVNTATWTETFYSTGLDGKERANFREECWAQVDTPRISRRFLPPGEGWVGARTIVEGDRVWFVTLERNHWRMVRDAWAPEKRRHSEWTPREFVRNELIFPRDPAEWQADEEVPHSQGTETKHTAWKMSREGARLRFVRQTTVTTPGEIIPPLTETETVWVEPETYRIVRRERARRFPKTWKGKPTRFADSRQVSEGYRYSQTPPPGTFDIPKPKVGEPYVFDDASQIRERVPSAQEQTAVRGALARTADAWNRKDAQKFLDGWDWKSWELAEASRRAVKKGDIASGTPQEQEHWRKFIAKGYPFPRWEVERIGASFTGNGVYVRTSEADPFPPSTKVPVALGANGTARVTDAQGRKWRVQLSANFQRQPDGTFKLTALTLSPRRRARL